MSTATLADRDNGRRLEQIFPSGQRITGRSLSCDMASVRAGTASHGTIPWMLPANVERLNQRREMASANRFKRTDAKDRAELSARIKASSIDPIAAKELADYRTFELTSDVMATPFALGAFQSVNLSADELPGIIVPRSRNLQRYDVRSVGQDGAARQQQVRTTKSFSNFEMELLTTDKVEYPLIDIQQGEVESFDGINKELQYDLEMKIDKLAQDNIDSLKTISGLRDLLHLHPLIIAANLPDTNYLDLSALAIAAGEAAAVGKWTITKIKILLDHVARFGAVAGDGVGEQLNLQTIMISPQNIRDPWDFIDLVDSTSSGTHPTPKETVLTTVRENIFGSGLFTSAWGHNFNWTANGRLAKGKGYALMSQPIGWQFTKTEFDQTLRWEGTDQIEQNYGQIAYRKCLKFVMPDLWKHRIVIFDL